MMSNTKGLIIICIVVIGIWFSYPLIIAKYFPELSDRGLFGDSFGALNTLISGFAFAGIIYTILLQQKQLSIQKTELELQRKELELTRKELTRTAEAQEKSEEALRQQAENTNLSAKLSALSSLFNAYHQLALDKGGENIYDRMNARETAKSIISKLEDLNKNL